ncbi:MAG TPA: hypothetical protein VGU25_15790 [Acidobacteriaceae bacterium]|nr:hypothetical protein [Acidobacteriaceae bacterium]
MATRKKPCSEGNDTVQPGLPAAYYQVHALLETVRTLACCEDDLCALLAEIRRSGKVGAGARRELLKVLHSMPVMNLHAEMDACMDALEEVAA